MSGRSDLQLTSNISISDNNLSAGLSSSVSESSGRSGIGGGGGMLGGFLGHVAGGVALPGEQFIYFLNETCSQIYSYDTCVFQKKIIVGADSTKKANRLQPVWLECLYWHFPNWEKVSILFFLISFPFISGLHPRSSQRNHHHHHLSSNRDFSRGNPVYDLAVQQQQQQQQQLQQHHQQQQYPYGGGTVTSNSTVAVSAVGRHRDYMNTFSSTSSFTLPSIIGEEIEVNKEWSSGINRRFLRKQSVAAEVSACSSNCFRQNANFYICSKVNVNLKRVKKPCIQTPKC